MEDLEWIVKLPFSEKACRQQDYTFAEQMGTKLTMKVVAPYLPVVKNKQKVIIAGYLYDITHVDPDKPKNEMYIYLEGVREIAQ